MSKPETKLQSHTLRARISCKMGREVLNGDKNVPQGTTDIQFALYCLLEAIDDIAIAIEKVGVKDD